MAEVTMTLTCLASAMVAKQQPSRNWHTSPVPYALSTQTAGSQGTDPRYLLLAFADFPQRLKYNLIKSLTVKIATEGSLRYSQYMSAYVINKAGLDQNTVTYNTKPALAEAVQYLNIPVGPGDWTAGYDEGTSNNETFVTAFLRNGALQVGFDGPVYAYSGTDPYINAYLKDAAGLGPAVVVTYDNSAKRSFIPVVTNGATSGYINPRAANTFSWGYRVVSGEITLAERNTQTSAAFYWSPHGQASWSAISVSGDTRTVTVPANTFPVGSSIDYYIWAERDDGTTNTSTHYTLSTAAAAAVATPVSPEDSVEDNSAVITFKWNVTTADGQAHASSELQYSTNGSSWTALATVTGNAKTYVCPADTLPSGTLYWRVRASNIDGTAGAWSSAVSFVSFGAPQAPSVTVQAGGFAIVRWQAEVQEAYRIIIDGETIGPFFGTDKIYQFEDYLEIGQHTVGVEVQNSFGLWSQPGTATFTVEQSAYAAPTVNRKPGKVGIDVELVVDNPNASGGHVEALYLYRDGKKIASLDPTVENQIYTDRFVLGVHIYKAVAKHYETDASYNEQIAGVAVEANVCCPAIAPFVGGEWMRLRLSDVPRRAEGFVKQRQVSLRHFTGAEYPVAEISPFTDASGSYDCAFDNEDDAKAFEALFGRMVILKTKADNVVIGILSGLEKRVNKYYISYTFSIQQIYWRDFVDYATD